MGDLLFLKLSYIRLPAAFIHFSSHEICKIKEDPDADYMAIPLNVFHIPLADLSCASK
jgi:hypothetical protein